MTERTIVANEVTCPYCLYCEHDPADQSAVIGGGARCRKCGKFYDFWRVHKFECTQSKIESTEVQSD